jgi:hypothetical protein
MNVPVSKDDAILDINMVISTEFVVLYIEYICTTYALVLAARTRTKCNVITYRFFSAFASTTLNKCGTAFLLTSF